jgi:hypothetical protein
MNPNGFVAGRVDHGPHVDSERLRVHRELVDERDVHVPERVLQELGELGLLESRRRDRLVDERGEELGDDLQRVVVDPRHDLRRVPEVPCGVARIDPLGAVPDGEVRPA